METLFTLLALCGGIPPVKADSPNKGPVMQSFDVLFAVA